MKTNPLPTNSRNKAGRRKLLSLFVLFYLAFGLTANATVNITTARVFNSANVAKLDQSADDADPTVGVVHIIGDLNINAGGSITSGGVPIIINVDGALNVTTGRFISGDGLHAGDSIHIVAGGNIALAANAIIRSNVTAPTNNDKAGDISLISNNGNISIAAGAAVTSIGNTGGQIILATLSNTGTITNDGLVQSWGKVSGTAGGTPGGGPVFIYAGCTLTVNKTGKVESFGQDPGADLVHLSACRVYIYGVVASWSTANGGHSGVNIDKMLAPPNRPDKIDDFGKGYNAAVEIWGDSIFIDASGTNLGEVKADLGAGAAFTTWIDILAGNYISVKGKTTGTVYPIHANVGGNNGHGGDITLKSLNGAIFSSGLFIQANATGTGVSRGGTVEVHSSKDLTTGTSIQSVRSGLVGSGGTVDLHSFQAKLNYGSPTNANVTLAGTVTTSNCTGTTGTLTVTGGSIVNNVSCVGNPDITDQPYVVIPTGCQAGDCICRSCIRIKKEVALGSVLCGPGTTLADIPTYWIYTIHSDNPLYNKVIQFPGNKGGDTTICNLMPGTYTVTESFSNNIVSLDGWLQSATCNSANCVASDSTHATLTLAGCDEGSIIFTNVQRCREIPEGCCWCNKGAVQSQVMQNIGPCCTAPDYLVDLRQGSSLYDPAQHNNNVPAFGSLQDAIDYVNANGDPNADGQIFIGVTVSDCGALDAEYCGVDTARAAGGDTPYGIENIVISNNSTSRLNVFGCSVTIWAKDPALPVITVNNVAGKGKITVLDLHVKGSNVAGYVVNNVGGDLVIVKNGRAMFNDIGYKVASTNTGKVEISGSPQISNNRIGISLEGTNTLLRTNSDIRSNSQVGISISGNGNQTNGNEVGVKNFPNGEGMRVSGNNNVKMAGDNVSYNTGNGITITGNGNWVDDIDIEYNGGKGIYISGNTNTINKCKHIDNNGSHGIFIGRLVAESPTGNQLIENESDENKGDGINANIGNFASSNKLTKNVTKNNTLHGIRACGQIDGTGNTASGNLVNPQIAFTSCTLRMMAPEDANVAAEESIISEIYPNPTLGNASIKFTSNEAAAFVLKVTDVTGRVVVSNVVNAKEGVNIYDIDLTGMAKGVYTVVLENSKVSDHMTVVVQ